MRAIPPIAVQNGDDAFYLGIAMLFIFGLAAMFTWIIGRIFIK